MKKADYMNKSLIHSMEKAMSELKNAYENAEKEMIKLANESGRKEEVETAEEIKKMLREAIAKGDSSKTEDIKNFIMNKLKNNATGNHGNKS